MWKGLVSYKDGEGDDWGMEKLLGLGGMMERIVRCGVGGVENSLGMGKREGWEKGYGVD